MLDIIINSPDDMEDTENHAKSEETNSMQLFDINKSDDDSDMLVIEIGEPEKPENTEAHIQPEDIFDGLKYTSNDDYWDKETDEPDIGNKIEYENEGEYDYNYIYSEESLLKDFKDNTAGSSNISTSTDWIDEKFEKKEAYVDWDDDFDCDAKKISKKAKKLQKQKKRLEKAMLKFCDDNNADLSDEIEMAAESDKKSSGTTKLTPYLIVEKMMENYNIVIVDGIIHIHDGLIYRAYFNDDDVHTPIQKILTREEKIPLRTTNYNDAVTQLYAQEKLIWDNPPISDEIIAFNNGVFNFVKNKKIKNPEKHFLNFKIKANFIPDGDLSSPHFDKFIHDITGGNKQAMRLIYYFIGGCIIPGNYAKSFFVLGTAPNTGKSIFGRFLGELIDDEQVSSVPLHNLNSDFHLARLKNKVMNISMDLDSSTISKTAVSYLKAITGNDKIDINPKYDKMTVMKRHGKLIFGTNHPIHLSQVDDAFWQRLVLIPLMCSVPKEVQDVHLDKKILKERDAIVTKALFCARELIKNYKFPKCTLADRMIEEWRFGDSASITLFIKECCKIDKSDACTHSQVLYTAYLKFCNANNFAPTNGNDFSRHLTKYFNLSRKKWTNDAGQYLWGFRGIELV